MKTTRIKNGDYLVTPYFKAPKFVIYALTSLVLLIGNFQIAVAHNWWFWHFDTSTIGILISGTNGTQANDARIDWDSHTDLSLPRSTSHTDISAIGGNFGATGWWGLASIEAPGIDWPWHCGWAFFAPICRVAHGHARFNTFYGGTLADVQGVYCQEIGHLFGLDHSNTGDCMGKSYFNAINLTGPHNWSDINARY